MEPAEAIVRGRGDVEFFARHYLGMQLHGGQLDWLEGAQAKINLLLTGNRWGKTTTMLVAHAHRQFYKLGAEPRYVLEDGTVDVSLMARERYYTVHSAGLYDTAKEVWREFDQLVKASPDLKVWLETPLPRSEPHEINWMHGGRWLFRTLGDNGEGIDGRSFYLVTIDEAGYEKNIQQIIDDVARMRCADVRGMIYAVGTAKPGLSQGFFALALAAQAYLGDRRELDYRSDSRPLRAGEKPLVPRELQRYALSGGMDLERMAHDMLQRRAAA